MGKGEFGGKGGIWWGRAGREISKNEQDDQ